MKALLVITLAIGLILLFSGYLIRKSSSALAGSKEGAILIAPKAFYITGIFTIIGGGILFLFGNPLLLIIWTIIPAPILLVYINSKLIRSKLGKVSIIIAGASILFVLSITAFLVLSAREPSLIIENDLVKISGLYGESIPTEDIREVSLTEERLVIAYRSNGLGLGEIKKGHFVTNEGHPIKLFLQRSKGPFIQIINNEGLNYYINFKDSIKTKSNYQIIKKSFEASRHSDSE
jgi:hypothetical protein